MNFPVFTQLAGNFRFSETRSLETASSSGESANFWFLKLRNRYPEPEHVRHQSQKGRKVRIRFPPAVSPYLGFVMLFTKVCGRTLVRRGCRARRRS